MGCIHFNDPCPSSGDTEQVLLAKILQALNEGGGGVGGGVTGLSVDGGPFQTGQVSITTGGGVQSVNGDPGPAVSLDSGEIPESGNLYFTEARVRATVLTGLAAALGAITAADTVLSAFGKTQGRLAALEAGTAGPFVLRAGDTMTGRLQISDVEDDRASLLIDSYKVTLAGAAPGIDFSGEWDTSGAPTAFLLNILDTASGAASQLFDIQRNSTSVLGLRRDGRLTLAGRLSVTSTSVGELFTMLDAGTASTPTVLALQHTLSGGAAAVGFGISQDWNLDSTTTVTTLAARFTAAWTDPTHATRTSSLSFFNVSSGTLTTALLLAAGQVQGNAGTVALPAFVDRNDTNTGLYFPGADSVGLSTGGTLRLTVSTTAVTSTLPFTINAGTATVSTPALDMSQTWNAGAVTFTGLKLNVTDTSSSATSLLMDLQVGAATRFNVRKDGLVFAQSLYFSNGALGYYINSSLGVEVGSGAYFGISSGAPISVTSDVRLYRDAAGILSQRNLAVAQTFRLTETTDAGLTNYSRLSFQTQAGNHLIRTEAAGTGTLRTLQVGTGPATGTNIAGVSTIIHGGQPTGNAVPGAILFQQGLPVGGSGSGVTALATVWQISTAGNLLAGTDAGYNIGDSASGRPGIINVATRLTSSGEIRISTVGQFRMLNPGDGIVTFLNTAGASFDRIQLGGTTSAFPSIQRSAAQIHIRLADNSADAVLQALQYNVATLQVVGARKTGWTLPTGTPTRTTFDTATVTLPELAERVMALLQDLHATAGHGLIGA